MDVTFVEEINAPPERVVAALTDIEAWHKWMPNLVRAEKLSDGPFGKGTRWRETRRMFGKEAAEEFEVVSFDPPRGLELFVDGTKGASKRGEYRFKYRFEDVGGRTRMTVDGAITGMGPLGDALGFFFKGVFRKAIAKDHQALRKFVEAA